MTLNKKLLKRFELASPIVSNNPIVIARFYYGTYEWYATHYYPHSQLFFGWIPGRDLKMSYFQKSELAFAILDEQWQEKRLSEVKDYV